MKIVNLFKLIDTIGEPNPSTLANAISKQTSGQLTNVEPTVTPPFSDTEIWKNIYQDIKEGIKRCEWPPNSGSFTLYDEQHGNGVKPIKDPCMKYLEDRGWGLETPSSVATAIKPGAIDATIEVNNKLFCVEWETGNISSSHRALNKLAVGLIQGHFIGGVLIVPSRPMYNYLTDRVGNIRELEPYFPIFEAVRILEGILAIVVIEHDAVSKDVPPIPKGNDGNSLVRREMISSGIYFATKKQKKRRDNTHPEEQGQNLFSELEDEDN